MMRELEELIRYIHANPSDKAKPLAGWIADLGQNSVYLRRLKDGSKIVGTRYVLSSWPESKSEWSATFRMDTLSLLRQESVTIEDLEIENDTAFDRDMIFFKMVLADGI
jgi:hypothetical protein